MSPATVLTWAQQQQQANGSADPNNNSTAGQQKQPGSTSQALQQEEQQQQLQLGTQQAAAGGAGACELPNSSSQAAASSGPNGGAGTNLLPYGNTLHYHGCTCPAGWQAGSRVADQVDSLVGRAHSLYQQGLVAPQRKLRVCYMLPHHNITGGMKCLVEHIRLLRARGHYTIAVHRCVCGCVEGRGQGGVCGVLTAIDQPHCSCGWWCAGSSSLAACGSSSLAAAATDTG